MRLTQLLTEYQESDSYFYSNGKKYNLNPIFKIYDSLKPIKLNTSELNWILNYVNDIDYNRVSNADVSYPIIVTYENGKYVIVDGLHRFIKQQDNDEIVCKFIPINKLEEFAIN